MNDIQDDAKGGAGRESRFSRHLPAPVMKRQLPVLQQSPLPPLYAAWMDDLLAGPIPYETDATCDECAMCATSEDDPREQVRKGGKSISEGTFFNPETKCCTYIPTLPNYLVGRIIEDADPTFATGRATVDERLRAGVEVTPLGLGPPPNFQALYGQSPGSLFGRSRTLRCPHYLADDGGRCGIWKHRTSICTTWYCKFVRGAVGRQFWLAMQQLLSAIEISLARWCVLELDIGPDALGYVIPSPSRPQNQIDPLALDGLVDAGSQRRLWGNWVGREPEFYLECARLVSALSWNDVIKIGGPEIKIHARLVSEAYQRLTSRRIPDRLKLGPVQILSVNRERSRISTYSAFDPLEIPSELMRALSHFDGRPTKEVLKTIAAEHEIKLDVSVIRRLADFEVLVPASD